MEMAPFGVFEPARFSLPVEETGQKPFFSDHVPLSQQERDAAILTDKLPPHEQDFEAIPEVTLARWLSLMSF
jgi:hypothetical protein